MPQAELPSGRFLAPAKINLALHVTGRRDDGYHCLESLVVFTDDIGDALSIEQARDDRLTVDGPFASGVPTDARNIVLKALALAHEEARGTGAALPPVAIRLTKNLPHAAGIGGGSADAAALLRHIAAHRPDLRRGIAARSVELGADVPMCIESRPAIARGIGEKLEAVAIRDRPVMVLANPRRTVATPAIFAALTCRDNPPLPALPAGGFTSPRLLVDWLASTRNDLQSTAATIEPAIAECLGRLRDGGADLARMSGSGATVFGLFVDCDAARRCAARISADHPEWWVRLAGAPRPC